MRRRSAASASRACVRAFSLMRRALRAASHSCWDTTLGRPGLADDMLTLLTISPCTLKTGHNPPNRQPSTKPMRAGFLHTPVMNAQPKPITQNADIRYLGKLLGDVIRAYGGDALFERIESIRASSVDRYR